ncbi:heavy-metal-associated domain-containing protein [Flavobacterium lacus]|uniref:Heavy-metal-associated domain-containing protein n=1 Tax=Flavobacterium lacus TaxID=1353778 RepID=A0A328WP46_9FLAO|nr:heavy metal-associated domain-containing protein [Flavobacterium lacus]RAR48082.1 heavy-metal-associated domain-containing protein [Flavobacterium lacus]
MKFTKKIAAIAFTTLLMVSCKKEATENTENATATNEQTQNQPAQLATASFTVEGMHCEVGCAGHLEKKLAKLDGVQKAEIDFEAKKATIEYDANVLTPEVLVQTVENAADGKTYKVSDVVNTTDKAMFFNKDKKKKKAKNKEKETDTSDEKKACSSGDKKACCASKKAETL